LLARRYGGLTREELDGSGLFRFITMMPGLSLRRAIGAALHRPTEGARLPVLIGWRRSGAAGS
jgi:hypothetical protein